MSSVFPDLPPEPNIEPEVLLRLIMAICDGGKKKARCTYPDCAHGNARAKAIAAWMAIFLDSELSAPEDREYASDADGLAGAIERSMGDI